MRYFYIRRQSGGCDYTIGCGISVEELLADNMEDAIQEVIDLPNDWKSACEDGGEDNFDDYLHDMLADSGLGDILDRNEFRIESGEILEVKNIVNMMPILKEKLQEVYAFKKEFEDKTQSDSERALYEKLHKKYGKKAKR
jgi:hypothetical protein